MQLRDMRSTEVAERKQHADSERRAEQKHVEQLGESVSSMRAAMRSSPFSPAAHRPPRRRRVSFRSHVDKEERKRIERLAKERLKVYVKFIDTVKDTCITHVLKQADTYLDSPARAIVGQQRSEGHQEIDHNMRRA